MQTHLNNKRYLLLVVSFLALAFPLFYFTYKFADPEPLAHDFFQYYKLYYKMDIANTISPHNMRLVGAGVVHLFYKLNIYYETETSFDKYDQNWGFLKQVYFDALLFNFLCVVGTCVLLFKIVYREIRHLLLAFLAGLLYLLGFGTIFYHLMPLTEACSTLLFTWSFLLYRQKNYLIALPLFLLILQREYILLAFGVIALVDLVSRKEKYYTVVLLISVAAFAVYYGLRKTLFYHPALDFQSTPVYMWESLTQLRYFGGAYIKQLVLTLNLFILYLGIVLYKYRLGLGVNRLELVKILLLFLQANFLSIAGGHGNNVGRYFYLVVPVVIVQLVMEAWVFFTDRSGVTGDVLTAKSAEESQRMRRETS